jgi:hypothetical protein
MLPRPHALSRRLRRLLTRPVAHAAALPQADRYRKHFPAAAHLWILLQHGLAGSPSLRQTHAQLDGVPGGWRRVGLAQRVSLSQLARSSTSRPTACFESLFQTLVAHAPAGACPPRCQPVQARDSTFLALSAKLSPWSHYRRHPPGVRLQTGYALAATIPVSLHWTLADTHDARSLADQDLRPLQGWTLVLDQGYYGHRQFQRLRAHAVDFICPLHQQAAYRVVADQPPSAARTPAGDRILADQRITLGSANHRAGAVVPDLRLITSQNRRGIVHRLVTSRHDLTAQEVVTLYRQRWQIELFFRWLKHPLGLLHPLGYRPEAIWLTILLAAILACLAALLQDLRPTGVSRIAWLRVLAAYLPQPLRFSA